MIYVGYEEHKTDQKKKKTTYITRKTHFSPWYTLLITTIFYT